MESGKAHEHAVCVLLRLWRVTHGRSCGVLAMRCAYGAVCSLAGATPSRSKYNEHMVCRGTRQVGLLNLVL